MYGKHQDDFNREEERRKKEYKEKIKRYIQIGLIIVVIIGVASIFVLGVQYGYWKVSDKSEDELEDGLEIEIVDSVPDELYDDTENDLEEDELDDDTEDDDTEIDLDIDAEDNDIIAMARFREYHR